MDYSKIMLKKLDELEALARAATPGPWLLQDSCSWRRIGTDPGSCGDVLLPVVQSDGQPDISASRGNLEYITAVDPTTVLSIIELVRTRDTEIIRHQERFDILVSSVAAALERAGVTSVDDPGEAIDVLVADKDGEISNLRQILENLVCDHDSPLDAATTTYFWNQARLALNKE